MSKHWDSFFNFPLAALLFSMQWWSHLYEESSWFVGRLVPFFALAVAVLQVAVLIRKLRRAK